MAGGMKSAEWYVSRPIEGNMVTGGGWWGEGHFVCTMDAYSFDDLLFSANQSLLVCRVRLVPRSGEVMLLVVDGKRPLTVFPGTCKKILIGQGGSRWQSGRG